MFSSVSVVITLQNHRTQYSESPFKANDSLEILKDQSKRVNHRIIRLNYKHERANSLMQTSRNMKIGSLPNTH